MEHTLSIQQTRRMLADIVDRFGKDHKATNPNGAGGCIYGVWVDGVLTPVCIVGQFFASLGLLGLLMKNPTATYNGFSTEPDQEGTCEPSFDMWERIERAIDTEFPEEVRQYLRDAQLCQDNGAAWGGALRYADDMLVWRAGNAAAERADIYRNDQPFYGNERYMGVSVEDCQEALAPVNDDGLAEWERELVNAESPF